MAISQSENMVLSKIKVGLDRNLIDNRNDLLVLTSSASASFFKTKPFQEDVLWRDAFDKIAEKLVWEGKNDKYDPIEGDLKTRVICIEELFSSDITIAQESLVSDVIVLVGLTDEVTINPNWNLLKDGVLDKATAITTFNCSTTATQLEKYGDYHPYENSPFEPFLIRFDELLKTRRNTDRKRHEIATDLWSRKSLDDLVFLMFVLIDSYGAHSIKSVQSVTNTESTSFEQVSCMCGNCADAMLECFKDDTCRKALDCLNKCKGNDQVCSYRCITSHETPAFERFAMCILQKHNCMGNHATVPIYPDPAPLTHFRGEALSFETAEDIFIGHLKLREGESNPLWFSEEKAEFLPWSWKVVCGQNPAYDYFACQHQLFYRDKLRPSVVWYDPVFRVTTLYGEDVWRRRHYRVRRAAVPGQFHFSVVDNGVVSKEFWRILDCADDLSWAVFYYGGAAAAAGTSYTGALVVTPDGKWPVMTAETSGRISSALQRAEITMWELFEVRNECCGGGEGDPNPPPLGLK